MTDEWMDDALCAGMPVEWFFPSEGGGERPYTVQAYCFRHCPVRQECLDYADSLPAKMDVGILGGLTEHSRFRIRQGRTTVEAEERRARALLRRHEPDLPDEWRPDEGE